MFNFGFTELIVLGTIALLVIGPKQLPQVAKAVAKLLKEVRSITSEVAGSLTDARHSIQNEVDQVKHRVEDAADFEAKVMDLINEKAKQSPEGVVAQNDAVPVEPPPKKKKNIDAHFDGDPGIKPHGLPEDEVDHSSDNPSEANTDKTEDGGKESTS
ncbi:MAG: hypothetical protein CL677_10310 [Bdellovibrionaceae bacterium]|nr:hypothetical protein [Pseudobdellovibrionaceae bacterium]|tara:strand:+ start:182108 stop:182578 length:471 start_codon:yes stop_codon:yes gene_type:complete